MSTIGCRKPNIGANWDHRRSLTCYCMDFDNHIVDFHIYSTVNSCLAWFYSFSIKYVQHTYEIRTTNSQKETCQTSQSKQKYSSSTKLRSARGRSSFFLGKWILVWCLMSVQHQTVMFRMSSECFGTAVLTERFLEDDSFDIYCSIVFILSKVLLHNRSLYCSV